MRGYGALIPGVLLAIASSAQAASDGKFAATSSGSLGITLVRPEAAASQSSFDVQMRSAGDYSLGATTQCLSGLSGAGHLVPATAAPPQGGETVLVRAQNLGPCARGGDAYRLLFMGGDPGNQAPSGALLLRPE